MTSTDPGRAHRGAARHRVPGILIGLLALQVCAFPSGAAARAPGTNGDVERLADLVERGNRARRNGRTEQAIAAYREARDIAPERYEVRLLLADTLRRTGRPGAAAEYEAAAALDPARPEAYAGQAMLRRAAFDDAGAAAILDRGLKKVAPQGRPDLLVSLAETRRREGRLDEAAALFTQALAAPGAGVRARAGLARVAEQSGDLAGALRWWERYLELQPHDTAAILRQRELKELRAAIEALRSTAKKNPGAAVLSELGRLLGLAGDAPGAMEACRAALEIEPRREEARRGLALAMHAAGAAGAREAFRRVLELRPDDGVAHYHLVTLEHDGGDLEAEESAWIALLESRPDDGFAARAFVGFITRAGQDALRRALDRFGHGGPTPRPGLNALLLASAQRWEEAAAALYESLRRDPSDPRTLRVANEVLYLRPALLQSIAAMNGGARRDAGEDRASWSRRLALLSRLHALAGRQQEFLDLARRATAADPRSAMAHSLLAEAMRSTGQEPEAVLRELEHAVALEPARLVGHVDLTLALLRSGRAAEAETAAHSGLEHLPEAAELLALLGAARMDQGDLEGAARAYRDALRVDPVDDLGLSRTQYPLVLAALGRQVEARQALVGDVPPVPEALYAEAWAFVREASGDRTYNGQDWRSWKDRFRGRLTTPAEAHRAIATLLASLGDPYTRLRDPEETAAVYLTRHGAAVAIDRLGRNRPDSRTVLTRDLADGLGYIRLSNLTDPTALAEVRKALEEMRDKEGLVLDLRGNPGGFTRAADAIGDLLVGPGVEAGVDVGPEGETGHITGGDGAVSDSPLVVLVDGQTGSAAERLARTLATAGRATLMGESTFGKGRFQRSRVLPGGMTVLVSSGEMLDPAGRPLQGRGLQPRLRIRRDGSEAGGAPAADTGEPGRPDRAAGDSPPDPPDPE